MSDTEMLEERLRGFLAAPDEADWDDVLRRADALPLGPRRGRRRGATRRRRRPLLVTAAAAAALAGAGVAIAAGFGVFRGISAAQHPVTAADGLDPVVAASLATEHDGLEPANARFVTQLPGGIRIYALPTRSGGLCTVAERLPGSNTGKVGGSMAGCGRPLTQRRPTTLDSFRANEATPPITWGIALDSVTAVSFMAGGREVTVPVKNNVWAYEGTNAAFRSLTVHFRNGGTETTG